MFKRNALGACFLAFTSLATACGQDASARRPSPPPPAAKVVPRAYRPGSVSIGEARIRDDGLKLQNTIGVLQEVDVDEILARHHRKMVTCYERVGDQRFVFGQVRLRFLVERTGRVSDVLVVASTLGHYAVERCLVVEARRIEFPPPEGDTATDFDYSLTFRSPSGVTVWTRESAPFAATLAGQMTALSSCGPIGEAPVEATVYVDAVGAVASAGLASDAPMNAQAAICAVERLRAFRVPPEPGRITKIAFRLP